MTSHRGYTKNVCFGANLIYININFFPSLPSFGSTWGSDPQLACAQFAPHYISYCQCFVIWKGPKDDQKMYRNLIWSYREASSLFNFSTSFSHNSPFPLALCMQTGTLIPLLHNCSEMLPFHRKDASHSHTLCKQDINCYTSEDMQHYA